MSDAATIEAPATEGSLATTGSTTPPAPTGPDPTSPTPISTPTHEPGEPTHEPAKPPTETPAAPGEGESETPESETAYADFQVPEGVELDPDTTATFSAEAKAAGLNQEQAQKFINMAVGLQQNWVKSQTAELIDAFKKQGGMLVPVESQTNWRDAAKLDAEYGGAKFTENLATVKRGLEAYGSPGLTQLLDATGLGNHPEILRLLFKAGKSVSEDSFVGGKAAGDQPKDAAAILYPNQKSAS